MAKGFGIEGGRARGRADEQSPALAQPVALPFVSQVPLPVLERNRELMALAARARARRACTWATEHRLGFGYTALSWVR